MREGAGDSIPDSGNSRWKGPETRRSLPYLGNTRKARIIVSKGAVE